MNLNSGNSGAELIETITKFAPDAAFEGAFCQHLGDQVCPKVYSISPGFYTMEKLEFVPRYPHLLRDIEELLDTHVWNRPSQSFEISGQLNWIEFQKSMGIITPDWVIPSTFNLIHGDPTVSNIMKSSSGNLILIDPRAPNGHVPSCKEVDQGKILQSYMGWETIAYNEPEITYLSPRFLRDYESRRKSLFWAFYHVSRIEQLERHRGWNRSHILDWCRITKEKFHHE